MQIRKQAIVLVLLIAAAVGVSVWISSRQKGDAGPVDQVSSKNVKIYTSEKFGVSFQYLEQDPREAGPTQVYEKGDRIYVYVAGQASDPEQGQYLQVFNNPQSDTLEKAIQTQLLGNYPNCEIITQPITFGEITYPQSYTALALQPRSWKKFPADDIETRSMYVKECPPYIQFGGVAYFLMDDNHPEKFVFLSIGQYAIVGSNESNGWQDTITFQ